MAARDRWVWVTATADVVDHAVILADHAAAIAAGEPCPSLCGRRFWAAPMITTPNDPCPRCALFVRARASMRPVENRLAGLDPGRWVALLKSRAPVASSRATRCASPRRGNRPQLVVELRRRTSSKLEARGSTTDHPPRGARPAPDA